VPLLRLVTPSRLKSSRQSAEPINSSAIEHVHGFGSSVQLVELNPSLYVDLFADILGTALGLSVGAHDRTLAPPLL
jgi:hypothetical protein